MKKTTLLTCTEFIASVKGNEHLLKMFRAEFKKTHNELRHLHTVEEWNNLYEQFKRQ